MSGLGNVDVDRAYDSFSAAEYVAGAIPTQESKPKTVDEFGDELDPLNWKPGTR